MREKLRKAAEGIGSRIIKPGSLEDRNRLSLLWPFIGSWQKFLLENYWPNVEYRTDKGYPPTTRAYWQDSSAPLNDLWHYDGHRVFFEHWFILAGIPALMCAGFLASLPSSNQTESGEATVPPPPIPIVTPALEEPGIPKIKPTVTPTSPLGSGR